MKPLARSALVKLTLPSNSAARGKGIKGGCNWEKPVTKPMQSWQVVQTLKTGESASRSGSDGKLPASMDIIGQSAAMGDLACAPGASIATETAPSASNCCAAIETAIASAAQPRNGSNAIMRMRRTRRIWVGFYCRATVPSKSLPPGGTQIRPIWLGTHFG